MRIERVELQGFRSFKTLATFDFDARVGVVRLGGRNDDEPTLGANGAGKSSLWEGVHWVLTGNTSTGLKGPEVTTWNAGRGVYGMVRIAGKTLVRTWGTKNTLTLAGQDVDQASVFEWLGVNEEQFLCTTYIAQHAPTFLDMPTPAKTDLLSSVLRLDSWLTLSQKTGERLTAARADLHRVEASIARLQGELEGIKRTDYDALIKQWRSERARRVEDAEEALDVAVNAHAAEESKQESAIQDLGDQLVAAKDLKQDLHDQLREAHELLSRAQVDASRASAALSSADKGACSACGREFPHEHTREELQRLRLASTTAEERVRRAKTAIQVLRTKQDDVFETIDALTRKLRAVDDAVRAASTTCKHRLDALEAARAEPNPYAGIQQEAETRLRAISDRVVTDQVERELLERHCASLSYWVKGFKDVRLFVVTQALEQLEVEVNACLDLVGLPGWEITFAPDAETKSGTVKRGLSVLIKSPSNPRPVPWSVWSGGEAQRLRNATTMGLANLIVAYTGYRPFVEVWDEATAGMSTEGVQDFLSAMQQRAESLQRQVWVVDHRALESGVFSKTVIAVKSSGTTTLELADHGHGE